jgi:hypothetical protein
MIQSEYGYDSEREGERVVGVRSMGKNDLSSVMTVNSDAQNDEKKAKTMVMAMAMMMVVVVDGESLIGGVDEEEKTLLRRV